MKCQKEFLSGIPEIIKCSLIRNQKILNLLTKDKDKLLKRDFKVISKLCYETLKIKISLFKNDIYEKNTRLFLNFGHTFAHAIEMATDKLIKKRLLKARREYNLPNKMLSNIKQKIHDLVFLFRK